MLRKEKMIENCQQSRSNCSDILHSLSSMPRRLLTSVTIVIIMTSSMTLSKPTTVLIKDSITSRWLQPCLSSSSITHSVDKRHTQYVPSSSSSSSSFSTSSALSEVSKEGSLSPSLSSSSSEDLLSSSSSSSLSSSASSSSSSESVSEESTLDIPEVFRLLAEKTIKLKKRVRDLKTLYVQQRFRDESIIEDLEQMGLRLNGMPQVEEPTIESLNNADTVEVIHRAFEHLARVAVFLDQARLGERLAVNEHVSFEKHFERLEDHHEDGLYWIMCSVHQIIYHLGEHPHPQAIQDVMGMKVAEVDRNAMRHTRDYLVLRDFEKLLTRLSMDFAALKQHHILPQ